MKNAIIADYGLGLYRLPTCEFSIYFFTRLEEFFRCPLDTLKHWCITICLGCELHGGHNNIQDEFHRHSAHFLSGFFSCFFTVSAKFCSIFWIVWLPEITNFKANKVLNSCLRARPHRNIKYLVASSGFKFHQRVIFLAKFLEFMKWELFVKKN